MGSGDGSQANQRFTLKNSPLTFVSAATASGGRSTLEVRVNGVMWEEVPSHHDQAATRQGYAIRIDDDSRATLIFGDGKQGPRLPTGQENITATYRAGLGHEAEVGADRLTLLKTRPFGVRSVTNPLAAGGAADPETRAGARRNAPLTLLTLDRVVSLQDFENFARTFAGIGKAQAVSLWQRDTYLVHLTIAAANGDEVPEHSDLYRNLSNAIDEVRDPTAAVLIASFERLAFNLAATISYDSGYLAEDVQDEIEAALLAAFSFDQREFGQAVTAAEIIAVIQRVTGVVAVDLDQLYFVSGAGSGPASVLSARTARRENGDIRPAQLLPINEAGINLTVQST